MPERSSEIRHVVGVMTGTSIDGLDAALVQLEGAGLEIRSTLVRHKAYPLGEIANSLRDAASQKPMTAGEFARLAWDFGCLHARAIADLLKPNESPDLICVHGQTVFHKPPISWQLINPAPIEHQFGCRVICDLRQADLAAGGQGAPITPLADWIMFRDPKHSRAIINLGGFCNISILPPSREAAVPTQGFQELSSIRGFDVCACNQLLNAIARLVLNCDYDEDGHAALAGRSDESACLVLYDSLRTQFQFHRSLGTGDELIAWVDQSINQLSANDLAATAVEAIARCIVTSLDEHQVDQVILAGGGVRNRALCAAIENHFGAAVKLSTDFGIPVDARESMAMAILGALVVDGVPIMLPQIPGRS